MAPSRIDDLRRRVEADPASIAFAQLAEEYRRAGQTEAAVRVCREGLPRHPGYLSARVTLGRALLDLGQLDEARLELQFVASEAPENLAAVRGLAEIFHREGDAAAALEHFQRALVLARHDPELEDIVQQLSRQAGAETGPSTGLTFEEAHQELLPAADRRPPVTAAEAATTAADQAGGATAPFNFDTLVAALGTPAAPPQVEAVLRGETLPVFELPDLPDLGADPFAALEAELRGQVESPGEQAAALEAPSLDEPAAEERIEERREEGEAIAISAAVVATELAEDPTDRDPDPDAEPVAPEPPSAAADAGPVPTVSAAERSETMSLVARSEREGNDPMADHADPTSLAPARQDDGAPGAAPAPEAAAEHDGVLDDVEDWLNSLQDRSSH